jgi:hypothetical protein
MDNSVEYSVVKKDYLVLNSAEKLVIHLDTSVVAEKVVMKAFELQA